MTERFINLFKSALDIEDKDISLATLLTDVNEWDSMGFISIMSMIDEEYNIEVSANQLKACSTVKDIYALAHQA